MITRATWLYQLAVLGWAVAVGVLCITTHPAQLNTAIFRIALKFSLNLLRSSFRTLTRTIGNHMYLSLGRAAREAGVAKSTISKALSSGKLSYQEKNPDGYKIDPAELFRVYPKTTKTSAEEIASNDWQPGQAGGETMPNLVKFEIQLAGLKSLIAEKDRRIADLEGDRVQLREDRHRLTKNWQEERMRLLKLIEDQTGTIKLLTDGRKKLVADVQRTFWQRVFRRKPKMAA